METNSDKAFAVAGSLGVHAFVFVLLYLGLLRQPELLPDTSEGPAIEATLVSSPQQTAAAVRRMQVAQHPAQTNAAPPPQPQPEPKPQDAPKPAQPVPQAQLPKPDTVDRDEVRRAAELAAREKDQQEQDERRRQAQVDLTRQQEQQDAENRQRQAQQQLDKEKQLADIRKKRADADRNVKLQEKLEEMKLKQLADASKMTTQPTPRPVADASSQAPTPPAGSTPHGMSLSALYVNAIKAVVHQNWHPQNVPPGTHCITHYKQYIGGEVYEVTFGDCPMDPVAQQSIRDALMRTPLPYSGFESAFNKEGRIDMCAPDDACK